MSNAEEGGDVNYSGVLVPKIKVVNTATRAGRRKMKKPEEERFEGSVGIDVDKPQPTNLAVLCMVLIDIYWREMLRRAIAAETDWPRPTMQEPNASGTFHPETVSMHDCG